MGAAVHEHLIVYENVGRVQAPLRVLDIIYVAEERLFYA
jgi:hypothetical protein